MCLLNDGREYALEEKLRSLAKISGTYIVGLFDCSRKILENASFADEEATQEENLILTFGCQPQKDIQPKRDIAQNYFDHLKRSSRIQPDGRKYFEMASNVTFFTNTEKDETNENTINAKMAEFNAKLEEIVKKASESDENAAENAKTAETPEAAENAENAAENAENAANVENEENAEIADDDENAEIVEDNVDECEHSASTAKPLIMEWDENWQDDSAVAVN